MYELKPLSKDAIPAALEKAQRYRTLNEPLEAESICLDVLEVDPHDREAQVTLFLALTDQFHYRLAETFERAREVQQKLPDDYSRAYYGGILFERRAKAAMKQGSPAAEFVAHHFFSQAMASYEKAAELRPRGNDDPILRWNTCARYLNRHPQVRPAPESGTETMLE